MERKPDIENADHAAAVELMARTAAGMTSASMLGLSLMTQAVGLWMGSVARTYEGLQKHSEPERRSNSTVSETKAKEPAAPSAKARSATVTQLRPHQRKARSASGRLASQAAKPAKGARTDDLKQIAGIGPKLESILQDAGIATFAQIAAMTKKDAEALDRRLGLQGRIARDDWVAKASQLGGKVN